LVRNAGHENVVLKEKNLKIDKVQDSCSIVIKNK